MILEHVAIWTNQLEEMKTCYQTFLGGEANAKYTNEVNQFHSYFLTFKSGARLELMTKPNLPLNLNNTIEQQHLGIIHLAFGVDTMKEVDQKAVELKAAGYSILRGPRKTGDGYYEFETLDPDGNRLEVTTKWVAP